MNDALPSPPKHVAPTPPMLGGGKLGEHIRATDWSATPLGDYATWPQSLRSSLSLVLNSPGIAALYWGPQQWLLYNDAYAAALGERHPWALGRPIVEALSDIAQIIGPQVARVLETGHGLALENVPLTLQRFGRLEPTIWTYSFAPIQGESGAIAGVLLGAAEMTPQQRTTVALQTLNAELEQQVAERVRDRDALWRLSSDIMLRCTFQGVITAANPAWTDLLGWEQDDLIGANLFDFIHPDDFEHTAQGAMELSGGLNHQRFDNRYRHRDGSYRWISWSTRAHDDLINAVGRDFTRDKERSAELEAAQNALRQSQKMEAVGQLTGGLAHDFNNLLAGISGALQLMQIRLQQGRFTDFERYIATAQGASKRAAALTHRLLAFSRQQTLSPKPTDVNRLIAELQELIQRTVGPATPLEVVGAADAWTALVDPSQLENALLNLCINARDAMPEGGRITVETANKWMDERAARQHDMPQGQYLSLCVSDIGTGMTPAVIARAFEPFFTTKPIGQGTGLGLSMIYGFAQQSGGQVRIYSEVGHGSTVCIYLPRHHGDMVDEPAPAGIAPFEPSRQAATVLVVDDEPTVRMLVLDILHDLGYAAIEAADSAAGLKILQSDARIDLLVSDVGLPGGMNGRQMADAARAGRPGLGVLFITGYAETAVLDNGLLAPGMAVLTKPFSVEAMAERIRTMVDAALRR